jgi:hypothetical protein
MKEGIQIKNITYNLEDPEYYNIISNFTNKILNQYSKYYNFIESYTDSSNTEIEEAILETLLIGIYWENYIEYANNLNPNINTLLIKLINLRNNHEDLKNEIDEVRGYLNTLLLEKKSKNIIDLHTDYYKNLINWLEATGEFEYEIIHLKKWLKYFQFLTDNQVQNILVQILKFTEYFTLQAEKDLGRYTLSLNNFLKNSYTLHKNKEDIILCTRMENEYHLQMFGAEIMNRIYREEFIKRSRKILLLPGCMRQTQKTCQAKQTHLGLKCQKCNTQCPTYQYKNKGEKEGYEVYTILHESQAFENITNHDKKEISIIGVACILNLINGGWKSYKLGMPAQCVILNYPGCSKHWCKQNITTNINHKELEKIITT